MYLCYTFSAKKMDESLSERTSKNPGIADYVVARRKHKDCFLDEIDRFIDWKLCARRELAFCNQNGGVRVLDVCPCPARVAFGIVFGQPVSFWD